MAAWLTAQLKGHKFLGECVHQICGKQQVQCNFTKKIWLAAEEKWVIVPTLQELEQERKKYAYFIQEKKKNAAGYDHWNQLLYKFEKKKIISFSFFAS